MPLKIYYLDDEEALCENFVDFFASPEVEVTTFTDPKKTIETAAACPPDLFFLDYRLPGTTGDIVAKALPPHIPKFLITGDISIKTEYKFEAVLYKPYDEAKISEILKGALRKRTA